MKNSLGQFNRFEQAEKRISEFEERATEITQYEKQKENIMKKNRSKKPMKCDEKYQSTHYTIPRRKGQKGAEKGI